MGKSGAVRKVMVVALLASALHGWAETSFHYSEMPLCCLVGRTCEPGGGFDRDLGAGSAEDAAGDPHPIVSMSLAAGEISYPGTDAAVPAGPVSPPVLLSCDYRSEVFRPPAS